MIRGIVFDKDGTLFDFRASWSVWAHGLLHDVAGHDAGCASLLGQRIGFDVATGAFAEDSPLVAGTPLEAVHALLPALDAGWNAARLIDLAERHAARTPMVEVGPLVPLLAELLARGLHLGVASNDSAAAVEAHLRAAGVRGAFGFVAGYDSGHGAKPGPGMLLAFARRHRIAPESVVMVGDSRHDLAAGRAAGMRTVAVLTGATPAARLADLADAVLPDVCALPGWLSAMAPAGAAAPDNAVQVRQA